MTLACALVKLISQREGLKELGKAGKVSRELIQMGTSELEMSRGAQTSRK